MKHVPTEQIPAIDAYQHYKGGEYIKLCEALHTENNEILVVYVRGKDGKVFARPKDMFYGVNENGEQRFKKIEQE